jgi:hypothetical protein
MIDLIDYLVAELNEAATKPGIMSLAGQRAENQCRRELVLYFKILGARIKSAHLEKLAEAPSKEAAKHAAEMKLNQIVRRTSDVLHRVLKGNYHAAMLAADKQDVVKEAGDTVEVGPASGLLSADAEAYAAEQAAKQIVGINQTTVNQVAELVATAVGNQMTPADLSKDIRNLLADMTKNRADTIARFEMADAFGEAALRKLTREDIDYKQLIASPDACPVCLSIIDNGPVPVDEPFVDDDGEEYDRSPIHILCRCATVGARAPEGEDDGD